MTADAADHRWLQERFWLGYAGLMPFLGCVAALWTTRDPQVVAVASDVMRYYAAVIASFLGAVHWGAAAHDPVRRQARLRWGVMPALIAWTLLLLPAGPALFGFALLFGGILVVDRELLPLLDASYRRLRLQLSLAVIAMLLLGAVRVPGAGA